MGWIILGAVLVIGAFFYFSLKAIALLARGILLLGAAAIRLITSLLP